MKLIPQMTEKELDAALKDLASMFGYACYHSFLSVRSEPGFPDWTLIRPATDDRPGRIVFVENKVESSTKGKLSPMQEKWRDLIIAAGGEWHLLRPSGLQEMAEILR